MVIDYTLMNVLIGIGFLGFSAGIVGVFAFLRGHSLLGDAISHAALPGIALMFLATRTTNAVLLLFGGIISGIFGAILLTIAGTVTRLKTDSLLGLVLSVFFGFGLVLITFIQKKGIAQQAVLNKFLFGNAALLLPNEMCIAIAVSCFVVLTIMFFWKEFKVVVFDPHYAKVIGYPVVLCDMILTFLLIVVIAVGLQMVGVVLMSSMIIAPAAAARQWSSRLSVMLFFAGLFGAVAAIFGSLLSGFVYHMPTGPAIVVIANMWVVISLLLATFFPYLRARVQGYFYE